MPGLMLVAETPNAGTQGHRFLVSDPSISSADAAELVGRESSIGKDYVLVRRTVTQLSTGREYACETLVLFGVDTSRLNNEEQSNVKNALMNRLHQLDEIAQSVDWSRETRLVVGHPSLMEWLNNDLKKLVHPIERDSGNKVPPIRSPVSTHSKKPIITGWIIASCLALITILTGALWKLFSDNQLQLRNLQDSATQIRQSLETRAAVLRRTWKKHQTKAAELLRSIGSIDMSQIETIGNKIELVGQISESMACFQQELGSIPGFEEEKKITNSLVEQLDDCLLYLNLCRSARTSNLAKINEDADKYINDSPLTCMKEAVTRYKNDMKKMLDEYDLTLQLVSYESLTAVKNKQSLHFALDINGHALSLPSSVELDPGMFLEKFSSKSATYGFWGTGASKLTVKVYRKSNDGLGNADKLDASGDTILLSFSPLPSQGKERKSLCKLDLKQPTEEGGKKMGTLSLSIANLPCQPELPRWTCDQNSSGN